MFPSESREPRSRFSPLRSAEKWRKGGGKKKFTRINSLDVDTDKFLGLECSTFFLDDHYRSARPKRNGLNFRSSKFTIAPKRAATEWFGDVWVTEIKPLFKRYEWDFKQSDTRPIPDRLANKQKLFRANWNRARCRITRRTVMAIWNI